MLLKMLSACVPKHAGKAGQSQWGAVQFCHVHAGTHFVTSGSCARSVTATVETVWGAHQMPIMLDFTLDLDDFQACPVCCDTTPLHKRDTYVQAFIHASAGEFNGLRLAWIGRAVFLMLGPLDLCWTHLEAISQAKSKRTSTGDTVALEYMQTLSDD